MLRNMYDVAIRAATHRHAIFWLAVLAFAESSVVPVPLEVMLVPMILADRDNAWKIAMVGTVASVVGGLAGYGIGYFLYDSVGRAILELYGYTEKFESFAGMYNEWGAWIVFGAGVTPFPYKVITIASGVTQLDLGVFSIASVFARGLRFFVIAALLWKFGPPMRNFIENNLGAVTAVSFIMLIGGFVAVKFVM